MDVINRPRPNVAVNRGPAWLERYSQKLFWTDTVVIFAAVFAAQQMATSVSDPASQLYFDGRPEGGISYTLVSLLIATIWAIALAVGGSREKTVIESGDEAYRRIIYSTFVVFASFGVFAYLTHTPIARGFLLLAMPLGLVALFLERFLWRKRLRRHRRNNTHTYRTLVVGERAKSKHVVTEVHADPSSGFTVVGAITERGTELELVPGVPVVEDYDHILDAVDNLDIDTLIISSADALGPERVREITWELERRGTRLVLAPALTDVAGSRIHMSPISGVSLIHVDHPSFTGTKHVMKRGFDIVGSSVLLVLLSPVLLVVGLVVAFDSPGGVFFKQRRVGLNETSFSMLKFRSMRVDAEELLDDLQDQSDGNGVLFKMKNDPRVTRSGKFLRRYSLDELPQLINVLKGDMSLVGPRPPLPKEVEQYADGEKRRLLVKPGITGLWQVSGRSDLSWDESVRLDLNYVENWSMTGDILILMRTVKAVFASSGAY